MLASARKQQLLHGCTPEFLLNDAQYLAFPNETFDAVRTDRVIQHTRDPFAVIREIARVTKESEKIVVFEPDWETLVIWPGERGVTRKILNFLCDRIPSGWLGRSLSAAFSAAELNNIQIQPFCLTMKNRDITGRINDLKRASDINRDFIHLLTHTMQRRLLPETFRSHV